MTWKEIGRHRGHILGVREAPINDWPRSSPCRSARAFEGTRRYRTRCPAEDGSPAGGGEPLFLPRGGCLSRPNRCPQRRRNPPCGHRGP